MAEGYRIEYTRLSEISRWDRNPKTHNEEGLDDSLDRFGFVSPLILDEKTGRLVAGHGRLDALVRRKASGKAPPARIAQEAGEWMVPVVRGVSFKNPTEAEAFLIADNRLSEIGGWDDNALSAVLHSLSEADALVGTGYSAGDTEALFKQLDTGSQPVVGKTPAEYLPAFLAAEIKQVTLYFDAAEYDAVVTRLEKAQAALGVKSNTEVFVKLLAAWEAEQAKNPGDEA